LVELVRVPLVTNRPGKLLVDPPLQFLGIMAVALRVRSAQGLLSEGRVGRRLRRRRREQDADPGGADGRCTFPNILETQRPTFAFSGNVPQKVTPGIGAQNEPRVPIRLIRWPYCRPCAFMLCSPALQPPNSAHPAGSAAASTSVTSAADALPPVQ